MFCVKDIPGNLHAQMDTEKSILAFERELSFRTLRDCPLIVQDAVKLVAPIGRDLIKKGIIYHVGTPYHYSFDGYGHAFVHLLDTTEAKNVLVSTVFDPELNCLYAIPSRARHVERFYMIKSPQELLTYAQLTAGEIYDGYQSLPPDIKPESKGVFYVYRHIFPDGRLYFGKGKGQRKISKNRGGYYEMARKMSGEPEVEILYEGISESEAYSIEHQMIIRARKRLGHRYVVNATDGLERAADIGDMPLRTLGSLMLFKQVSIEGTKFDQRINLCRKASGEAGAEDTYSPNITLYHAANEMKCTLNEVLSLIKAGNNATGAWRVVSDEEMEAVITRRRLSDASR